MSAGAWLATRRGRHLLIALSIAAGIVPPPVLAAASAGYVVQPVRASIADDALIGGLASGVACIPAGKTHWSDFALDGERLAARVAEALVEAGVTVDQHSTDAAGRLSIRAEITQLSATLCRPRYNMLKLSKTGLKGSGTMTVRWRVGQDGAGRVSRNEPMEQLITAPFSLKTTETSLGAVLTAGMRANAEQFARRLTQPPSKL